MNRLPYYPELRELHVRYGDPFKRSVISEAFQILGGIPVDKVDLSMYISTGAHREEAEVVHDCGTLACAGGWLALHPDFGRKHNIRAERQGDGYITNGVDVQRGPKLDPGEEGSCSLRDFTALGLAVVRKEWRRAHTLKDVHNLAPMLFGSRGSNQMDDAIELNRKDIEAFMCESYRPEFSILLNDIDLALTRLKIAHDYFSV